jgi:5-methylcytosine-specific restriction endonuclease McrA
VADTCAVDRCDREDTARGWCDTHYQSWYRTVNAQRLRTYRQGRKAIAAERMAAWRPTYNETNREAILARRRAAYAANPRRAIANVGRWKEEHPTRARAIAVSAKANSRAEDAGADGRLTPNDVIALWRRQPDCVMCGDGAGLDHIVPFCRGGANTTGNIQNLCRRCNSRKGRKLPEELVA